MTLVGMLLIGAFIGWFARKYIKRDKPVGTLRVDSSDPDGPFLFLELENEAAMNIIKKRKFVTMKVDLKSYISQK